VKFLIWAWNYQETSGGCIALHRLAHNLATLGHEARLYCSETAPGWKGDPVLGFPLKLRGAVPDDHVAVYPEVVEGNPFHGQRVVRWLLNTPGFFGPGNGNGLYGERDLIMWWDEKYRVPCFGTQGGKLTAYRDLSHFRDLGKERDLSLYLVRKGKDKPLNQHSPDALPIDNYTGDEALIRWFNRCTDFVCYDDRCMVPTLANLCGVPKITIVGGGLPMTREQVEAAAAESIEQTRSFVDLCGAQWQS